jgi:hypothetical protein
VCSDSGWGEERVSRHLTRLASARSTVRLASRTRDRVLALTEGTNAWGQLPGSSCRSVPSRADLPGMIKREHPATWDHLDLHESVEFYKPRPAGTPVAI